jgi:hypothetical protein
VTEIQSVHSQWLVSNAIMWTEDLDTTIEKYVYVTNFVKIFTKSSLCSNHHLPLASACQSKCSVQLFFCLAPFSLTLFSLTLFTALLSCLAPASWPPSASLCPLSALWFVLFSLFWSKVRNAEEWKMREAEWWDAMGYASAYLPLPPSQYIFGPPYSCTYAL